MISIGIADPRETSSVNTFSVDLVSRQVQETASD